MKNSKDRHDMRCSFGWLASWLDNNVYQMKAFHSSRTNLSQRWSHDQTIERGTPLLFLWKITSSQVVVTQHQANDKHTAGWKDDRWGWGRMSEPDCRCSRAELLVAFCERVKSWCDTHASPLQLSPCFSLFFLSPFPGGLFFFPFHCYLSYSLSW